MKNQKKHVQIIIFIIASVIIAACLTAATLLRLPAFYEQTTQERIITFILLCVFLFLMVLISAIFFVFPCIDQLTKKSNLIFIITMFIFLTAVLAVSSAHFWAVPQIHSVQLCFDASNGEDSLKIQKLVDPNTNRLYSPNSFGSNRYPIILDSGTCVDGQVMNLLSRLTLALIGYRIDVFVQDNPPDGRLLVSVNEAPAVVTFNRDDQIQTATPIVIKDGFDKGMSVNKPWGQLWFAGIKFITLMVSSIFITLVLFGITEHAFDYSDEGRNLTNGAVDDQY